MKKIKDKISIIIPAYNCADTIISDLKILKEKLKYIGLNREFEIIIVDDGSSDNTYDMFNGSEYCDCAARLIENSGKGAALKEGFQHAGGEYVVFIDTDAQIDCEDLMTFFNLMDLYQADAVIGNKRHIYSDVKYNLIRWIVSNVYNLLCRFLFGIKLRDTQCGFKLFRRRALLKIMSILLVKRFAFDLELIVAMKSQGLRIADAPVRVMLQKNAGSVSWRNIYMTAIDTLAVWYRWQKGWYNL